MIPYDFIYPAIVDYIMQFDDFLCYRDIGSKAFFTMATLLMPLLENVVSCPTRTKNLEQSLTIE